MTFPTTHTAEEPSAFPGEHFEYRKLSDEFHGEVRVPHPGMSLRDYYAGQALVGQLAFSPSDDFEKVHMPEDMARLCWRFADAMMEERARTALARASGGEA